MLQVSLSTYNEDDLICTEIPLQLLESLDVWDQVLTHNTWSELLTDTEREHLSSLLPKIPTEQQRDNIEQLFARKEFRFGTTPLTQAYFSLKQLTPHCTDWVSLEARQSARLQHRRMTLHYSQIVASLCDSRKKATAQEEQDSDRKKLQKLQNKLWKSDRFGYETEKAKRDRVKAMLQTEVPPLPHGTTRADIQARIEEIMLRHNYQPPLERQQTHPLPNLIKNRPRIKVKSHHKPKLKPAKHLKSNHTHPSSSRAAPSPADSLPVSGQSCCFFSLIRQLFRHAPCFKLSLERLEREVSLWQERQLAGSAGWLEEREDWPELTQSAVCYLAVETGAYSVEHTPAGFYPLVELKDRTGQWEWIGQGRDPDDRLEVWCMEWLNNLDKSRDCVLEYSYRPPRPPIHPSVTPVCIPTPEPVVASFRRQESIRYQNPHKSYTYILNSNRCVVAPVKGVVSRERAGFKVREHTLLDSTRPPCVTILTLVRDAVARLENGEGTRQDICQLVQDSQFINSSASETHINAAVSGALDRLHYEKDPCVRFENSLKLWVYLHRYRSEQLFNEIHHLQICAINLRKKLLSQLEKGGSLKPAAPAPPSSPLNEQDELSSDSHSHQLVVSHPGDPSSRASSPSPSPSSLSSEESLGANSDSEYD